MPRIQCNRMQYPYTFQRYGWLMLLLGLLMSFSAMAETAGRLLFARGDVQLIREGTPERAVKRGDAIEVGDILRTGEEASAQLRLNDGAKVALRADTTYKIDAQNFNEESPEEGSQAGQLLRGGLRVITGAIGKERPSAVKLDSPVATIGIRGTVYETIYIPPEGNPGVPNALPGQYVLVLKGQVSVTSAAGELSLGVGELGYVADPGAEPELRPDFSWLFERFATLNTGSGGSSSSRSNSDGFSRSYGSHEPDTGEIDNVLTESTISLATEGPTAGPLAFVVAADSDFVSVYQARFESEPVTLGAAGELLSAQGGTGDFFSLSVVEGAQVSTGSATAGDSTINWGAYSSVDVILNPVSPIGTSGTVFYITATEVLASIDALPTTGNFTYNYVGGSGQALTTKSSLTVDFASSSMDVSLGSSLYAGAWTATNQPVSSFYSSTGINLNNAALGGAAGNINGSFVGSNAEGAMAMFWYENNPDGGSRFSGTAAFAR